MSKGEIILNVELLQRHGHREMDTVFLTFLNQPKEEKVLICKFNNEKLNQKDFPRFQKLGQEERKSISESVSICSECF